MKGRLKHVPALPIGVVHCGARRDGMVCTIPSSHKGKHKATGPAGTRGVPPDREPVLHEWPDKIAGFAQLDPAERRRIASLGGKRCHELGRAHRLSGADAVAAGRIGGAIVSRDRKHMAAIGRLGGLAVSRDAAHMSEIGGKGGSSMSDGPRGRKHMAEIGKRGGLVVSRGKSGRRHMSEIAKKGAAARRSARTPE